MTNRKSARFTSVAALKSCPRTGFRYGPQRALRFAVGGRAAKGALPFVEDKARPFLDEVYPPC